MTGPTTTKQLNSVNSAAPAVHLAQEAAPSGTQGNTQEASIASEPIFQINNFTVTNSLLTSWVVVVIVAVVSVTLFKNIKKLPKKLQNVFEIIIDEALKMCDNVTGSRAKTMKIFPIVFGLFIFILLNNWLGILPGVGTVGFVEASGGKQVFVPLLRGGTADLNTTLILALISVVGANLFGIVSIGIWKYFNRFINVHSIIEIPRNVAQDASILIVNPIKFFLGIIEIIGEIAKVASLSFRLFGNIFAGEILLASMSAIFAYLLPIPFIFLEVIVGIVQALIFSMLTLVYFTISSEVAEH